MVRWFLITNFCLSILYAVMLKKKPILELPHYDDIVIILPWLCNINTFTESPLVYFHAITRKSKAGRKNVYSQKLKFAKTFCNVMLWLLIRSKIKNKIPEKDEKPQQIPCHLLYWDIRPISYQIPPCASDSQITRTPCGCCFLPYIRHQMLLLAETPFFPPASFSQNL